MGHAQHISHGRMANMRYVLLTWNPGPEDDEQYLSSAADRVWGACCGANVQVSGLRSGDTA